MPSDTGKKRRAINKRIDQMIDDMSERHSRVCVTRIDITYPEEQQSDGSNKDIIRLHNNLRSYMDRNNIDCEYVTVREQVDSHNPHYHSIFCTDGSKLSKPKRLQETSNDIWKGIVGSEKNGLVHFPKNNKKHRLPPLQMLKRLKEMTGNVSKTSLRKLKASPNSMVNTWQRNIPKASLASIAKCLARRLNEKRSRSS